MRSGHGCTRPWPLTRPSEASSRHSLLINIKRKVLLLVSWYPTTTLSTSVLNDPSFTTHDLLCLLCQSSPYTEILTQFTYSLTVSVTIFSFPDQIQGRQRPHQGHNPVYHDKLNIDGEPISSHTLTSPAHKPLVSYSLPLLLRYPLHLTHLRLNLSKKLWKERNVLNFSFVCLFPVE